MKKTVEIITPADHKEAVLPSEYPDAVIIDIEATGRFWRNSRITSCDVIRPASDEDGWKHIRYEAASEPEEFEILEDLPDEIQKAGTLITFNGRTFDLPYLNRKYMAYGLANPLTSPEHRDLMADYRPLTTLLGLPSYRLSDLMTVFTDQGNEAVDLLYLLSFDSYLHFFRNDYRLVRTRFEADLLFFELELPKPVPKAASYRDGVIHVRFEDNTVRVASPVIEGKLHLYYPDYKEYDYLPAEGQAVHKSLSRFVDPSHREPAQRETAFTLIPFDGSFIKNERRQQSYLTSLVNYLSCPFKERSL